MKHATVKSGYCGIICGIMLAVAGTLMLGVKLGWIPEEVMRSVPFFPLALILFGALIIYSSVSRRRKSGETGDGTGACC